MEKEPQPFTNTYLSPLEKKPKNKSLALPPYPLLPSRFYSFPNFTRQSTYHTEQPLSISLTTLLLSLLYGKTKQSGNAHTHTHSLLRERDKNLSVQRTGYDDGEYTCHEHDGDGFDGLLYVAIDRSDNPSPCSLKELLRTGMSRIFCQKKILLFSLYGCDRQPPTNLLPKTLPSHLHFKKHP